MSGKRYRGREYDDDSMSPQDKRRRLDSPESRYRRSSISPRRHNERQRSPPSRSTLGHRSPSPRSRDDSQSPPRRQYSPHRQRSPLRQRSPQRERQQQYSPPRRQQQRQYTPSPPRQRSPPPKRQQNQRSSSPERSPSSQRQRSPQREKRQYSSPPRQQRQRSKSPSSAIVPGQSRTRYNDRLDRHSRTPSPRPKLSKREMKEEAKQIHESATGRTGGVYIPPFKMRLLEKSLKDKSSEQYQRLTWDALKKSLNGIVNKVSLKNIVNVLPEIFSENLTRGMGPLCQSLMKSQSVAPTFTNIYAALIAVVNTKLPEIGELLCKRLIDQWKKAYQRNQKATLISTTVFLAHLVNQNVCGVLLPLQMLALLLDKPTDDSVEVAVNFVKECGQHLSKVSPRPFNSIFDVLRTVLQEGSIDKRVQYMIEHLFIIRKANFFEHPSIVEELDLVEEGDQITHADLTLEVEFDEEADLQQSKNLYHFDPDFEKHEKEYEAIRDEILGNESDEESGEAMSEEEEGGEQQQAGTVVSTVPGSSAALDFTGDALKLFKRKVYLIIVSSLSFEECAHKLVKSDIPPEYEMELCNMIVECCAQEKTYRRFYGLLGQRFCELRQVYRANMMELFPENYESCHMLETNKLRNVAQFFAHLLHSDAIAWTVLKHIHMNEKETNSSKRIFVKIMFKELAEYLGLDKLSSRMDDVDMVEYFQNLMPHQNPENLRFSINFFTSIGLGGLTVSMRERLRLLKERKGADESSEVSSSLSSSSGSSSSSSSSGSSSSSSSSSGSSSSGSSSSSSSD